MSKAFTREDDASEEAPFPRRSPLPPGVKNLMTIRGIEAFREEVNRLTNIERPQALAAAEASGSRFELQRIDQRIALVTEILGSAVPVEVPPQNDQVRFGAEVTVRDSAGGLATYQIVGVDEADVDRNLISWRSPLARALLNKRVGERSKVTTPAGEQQLEIVSIAYPEPPKP